MLDSHPRFEVDRGVGSGVSGSMVLILIFGICSFDARMPHAVYRGMAVVSSMHSQARGLLLLLRLILSRRKLQIFGDV